MASTDFTATVEGPITIFKAVSPAALTWLRTSGKADSDNPSITRRDGASASIFLEALKRKGFTCDLPEGWEKRSLGPTDSSGATAGVALGCVGLMGVIGIGAYAVSSLFGGSDTRPAAQPVQTQASAPTCSLPDCVEMDRAGVLGGKTTTAEAIIKQPSADFAYIGYIASSLPTLKPKDEFETTASYRKRAAAFENSWKIGEFTDTTPMMLVKEAGIFNTYDPDTTTMRLSEHIGSSVQFGNSRDTREDSPDDDPTKVKFRTETTTSDDVFFTNMGTFRRDGCSPDYKHSFFGDPITFKIDADNARRVIKAMKIHYVVDFKVPASAATGDWCYSDIDRSDTNMLIPGRVYTKRYQTHYVNMRLRKIIVSAGEAVLWSRDFK